MPTEEQKSQLNAAMPFIRSFVAWYIYTFKPKPGEGSTFLMLFKIPAYAWDLVRGLWPITMTPEEADARKGTP